MADTEEGHFHISLSSLEYFMNSLIELLDDFGTIISDKERKIGTQLTSEAPGTQPPKLYWRGSNPKALHLRWNVRERTPLQLCTKEGSVAVVGISLGSEFFIISVTISLTLTSVAEAFLLSIALFSKFHTLLSSIHRSRYKWTKIKRWLALDEIGNDDAVCKGFQAS